MDDYVLVDRKRWPQRKLKKTESQWFGPFRVTEVRHNTAKVAASPNLGGEVLVTFDQLKHWNSLLDYDDSDDEGFEPDMGESEQIEVEEPSPPQAGVADMETNTVQGQTETVVSDFYEVERILNHKYQQGWKFLTQWKNYPVTSATWEPPKHFVMPDGHLNEIFSDYVRAHSLEHVVRGRATHKIHLARGVEPAH